MSSRITLSLLFSFIFISVNVFAQETVLMGAMSSVDITPPIGVPLGGFGGGKRRLKKLYDWGNKLPYATYLQPSIGQHDPIRSKVMVLQKGTDRLVFISVDVVGMISSMVEDIAKRLERYGIQEHEVFVGGTHTHSGPGTLSKRKSLALLAMDRFNRKIYEQIMKKIIDNVAKALKNIEPVNLYRTNFKAIGLQSNRANNPGHYDDQAKLLVMKSKNDEMRGVLVNFAVHGTALGQSNLKFSADITGAMERYLEKSLIENNPLLTKAPTVMLINGAEGDVSPRQGGLEGMAILGKSFAEQAMTSLKSAKELEVSHLFSYKKEIYIGKPGVILKSCLGNSKFKKYVWKHFRFNLGKLMPRRSSISIAEIGNLTLMTWPGEATTSLGIRLQNLAKKYGRNDSWVLGLTNDYLAYFTTKEEFKNPDYAYESCSSLYNYAGGKRILKGYQKIFNLLQQ